MKSKLLFSALIFTVVLIGVFAARFTLAKRYGEIVSDSKLIALYEGGTLSQFEKAVLSKGWEFERFQEKQIVQKSSPDLPRIAIIPIKTEVSSQVLTVPMTQSMKQLVPRVVFFRNGFDLIITFFDLDQKKPGYALIVPIFS